MTPKRSNYIAIVSITFFIIIQDTVLGGWIEGNLISFYNLIKCI